MSEEKTDIFNEISKTIETQIKLLEKIPEKNRRLTLQFLEHEMMSNLELIKKIIETHDIPPHFKEIYSELHTFIVQLLGYFKTGGSRRQFTRTKRGGGNNNIVEYRQPSRTNIVERAQNSIKRSNIVVGHTQNTKSRSVRTDRPSQNIVAHARNLTKVANSGRQYQRIARQSTIEAVQDYTKFASWGFGTISKILFLGTAGVIGAGFSSQLVDTTAYYSAAVTNGIKTYTMPKFLFGEGEPTFISIPPPLMSELVDYNSKYAPKPIDVSTTGELLDQQILENVHDHVVIASHKFTEAFQETLSAPFVSSEWPRIKEEILSKHIMRKSNLEECRTRKGFGWGMFKKDPCLAEMEAETATLSKKLGIENTSAKLTTRNIVPRSAEITGNVASFSVGIAEVLDAKGDIESRKKVEEIVNVFNGIDGIGLAEGEGRFSQPLLSTMRGYESAKKHCSNSIQKVLGPSQGVVKKVANLLMATCDLQISKYTENAQLVLNSERIGEDYADALDKQTNTEKAGFNRIISIFTDKRNQIKDPVLKAQYTDIIKHLNEMDIVGIRFPNDVGDIIRWASIIDEHYKKYRRVERPAQLFSTNEYKWQMFGKSYAKSPIVQVYGFLGGVSLATLISSLSYLFYISATGSLYGTAAVGSYLKRQFEAQQSAGRRQMLEMEIDEKIARGELLPEEATRMKVALRGNLQLLANTERKANVKQTTANRVSLNNKPRNQMRRIANGVVSPPPPQETRVAPQEANITPPQPQQTTNTNNVLRLTNQAASTPAAKKKPTRRRR